MAITIVMPKHSSRGGLNSMTVSSNGSTTKIWRRSASEELISPNLGVRAKVHTS